MTAHAPFIARLFKADRPFEQIELHALVEGETRVGRDPEADWSIDDACASLSRIHCSLVVDAGRIFLRDRSTNGTYLADGARVPFDEPIELQPRDLIRLGGLSLLIDSADAGDDVLATRVDSGVRALAPSTLAKDWMDAPASVASHRDASLIEAFCEGAKLDVSAFSSEEPVEFMRRIGAVYQQTIIGLAALMAQRASTKAELHLDRTTISAADNNPFKWAPTRKLAEDLLRPGAAEFKAGAEAVRASFEDLSGHMAGLSNGARTMADFVMSDLAPEAIEAEAKANGSMLRSRPGLCWEIHARRHAALKADSSANGVTQGAFADGYLGSTRVAG